MYSWIWRPYIDYYIRVSVNFNILISLKIPFLFQLLGLDYPGVGPEHAFLKDSGRATYVAVTDKQAMEAFFEVSKTEGNVISFISFFHYISLPLYDGSIRMNHYWLNLLISLKFVF